MNRIILACVGALITAAAPLAYTAESADVARAREQLDSYYGNQAKLEAARALLEKAIQVEPNSADVYVQAARLAVMSGYIVGNKVQDGTQQTYHFFLDKALALDPLNAKAHILKAEANDIQGRMEAEKAALDKARELNSTDPWLWNGYARYHRRMGQPQAAAAALAKVIEAGPGKTASDRKAYVNALEQAAKAAYRSSPEEFMKYVTLIRKERDPADAWVLGNLAGLFNFYGGYDEAMELARDARRVMDYGVARVQLSAALYGKAARLIQANEEAKAEPLIKEAATLGTPPERIVSTYGSNVQYEKLVPILQRIVK